MREIRNKLVSVAEKLLEKYTKDDLEYNFRMYCDPSPLMFYNKRVCITSKYSKENILMENISCTSKLLHYEEKYDEEDFEFHLLSMLESNIKKISSLTGKPTIAYLTGVNKNISSSLVEISNEDIVQFSNLIEDIPLEVKEVNIVLHSRGGYMKIAKQLVELIRHRFEQVTYIIPQIAHSAATMMCMSADEIIMTPESSLSPFDVQIQSPTTGNYYSANDLLKIANQASKSFSPLYSFIPKSDYSDWSIKMIDDTRFSCKKSIALTRKYSSSWLMKYLFKFHSKMNHRFSKYFIYPWWVFFTQEWRTTNRIVSYFTDSNFHIIHDNPIMFNDIKDIGLNVKCAELELLSALRETYTLTNRLLDNNPLNKLYINDNKSLYLI